jgi:hypothetical protein
VIKRGISIVAMCFVVLAIHNIQADEKGSILFRYDRLDLMQQFVKAVYPDLSHQLAMFDVRATFEGDRGVALRNLKFYPCLPSTGITPEGDVRQTVPILSEHPVPPVRPSAPMLPRCGEEPTPEFEHFLDVSLGFTPGHQSHPIFRFAASGNYVDGKLQTLRQDFAGKPYPSDDDALRALGSGKPKYGPEDRKAFLQIVPLEKIQRLTGCHLRPESATFVIELEENPQHLPPDLQWHLSGNAPAASGLPATTCSAAFEPFDGHLTLFLD